MSFLLIPNDEIVDADIPASDSLKEHWGEFALSFPGYEIWGGVEGCGRQANPALKAWEEGSPPTGTLTELRTWLFFEQRRAHHYGEDYNPDYYAYLIAKIREECGAGRAGPTQSDAFPSPAGAEEARKSHWQWVRYNVEERFRLLETSALGPKRGLVTAERHGVHYLLSRPGLLGPGAWDAFAFSSLNELREFVREPSGPGFPRA